MNKHQFAAFAFALYLLAVASVFYFNTFAAAFTFAIGFVFAYGLFWLQSVFVESEPSQITP